MRDLLEDTLEVLLSENEVQQGAAGKGMCAVDLPEVVTLRLAEDNHLRFGQLQGAV